MKLPKQTQYGKFRLRSCWRVPASEAHKPMSSGYWLIEWEGVDNETGLIVKGFKGLFYPNLYYEAQTLEKELRKEKIIVTSMKFKKS